MTSVYWTLLLLLIPVGGWFFLWWKFRTIVVWEWAAGLGAAVLILTVTFVVAARMAGSDEEVLSGYAFRANHTPWWRAEWLETVTHTTTDAKGNVSTYTTVETRSRTYPPEWWLSTQIGSIYISEGLFDKICGDHGRYKQKGYRPDFDRGDRYDYFSDIVSADGNNPEWPEYPVHKIQKWNNPLVGTGSIKLGKPVPEEEARQLNLFEYPRDENRLSSTRVLGGADVSTYRWDQMCAILGPSKHVNLILIYFGDRDMADAVKQRDYWRNGKKNDLVLCYSDEWAYVFGWSANTLVKEQLQATLLDNEVNTDLVTEIALVVQEDFEPYPWEQHADTPRPVKTGAVVLAFFLMAASQVGLGYAFHYNSYTKDGAGTRGLGYYHRHRWR